MKVLHLQRIGGIGGSERHVLELLPALRDRGIDARFLGLDDRSNAPDPFYEVLAARQVPFERLDCPRDIDPRLVRRTSASVRRFRPDLVHTHLVHADVYGAYAALRAGARLVSTKHNDDPFRSGHARHGERLLTRRADRVICITEALERFTREVVGLPAEKLSVVHYGLDAPPEPWGRRADRSWPPRRRCSWRSAGSSRRRASTSRSRRWRSCARSIPRRTSSSSARARSAPS